MSEISTKGFPMPTADNAAFALTSQPPTALPLTQSKYGTVPGSRGAIFELYQVAVENVDIGDFSTVWYLAVTSDGNRRWWAGKTSDSRQPNLAWVDSETGEELTETVLATAPEQPWYNRYAPALLIGGLAVVFIIFAIVASRGGKK
jgi:hypothetical protein